MPVTFTNAPVSSSPSAAPLRKQHTIFEKGYRSEDGNISKAFDDICERFTSKLSEKKKASFDLNDIKCMAFIAIKDHIPLLDTDTLMNTNNKRILDSTLKDRDGIESALKAQFKTKKTDYQKTLISLKDDLIKLVERPTIKTGRHTQVAGSIGIDPDTNSLCVIKGVTHSQERANKSALHDKDASNANLACIDFDGTISVGRSGCPDSKTKVLEILQFLAIMELEKQIESGEFSLTPATPGSQVTFEASEVFLMTLMDLDRMKEVGEAFAKKTEKERIRDIQKAVDSLTSNDLMFSTSVNGTRVLFRLKRPSMGICPFSFSTTTAMAEARNAKKGPYTQKFDRFVKQWETDPSGLMKSIIKSMKQEPRNFTTIFEDVGTIIRKAQQNNESIPEQTLGALNALKIGLSDSKTTFDGMDLTGDPSFGTRNPETITEFIFDVMLSKELGDILAVSCKSGQDRTGTAAAIVVALDNYKEITGHYFLPTSEKEAWEDPLFKFLFTMAIDDFCESFHRITRGDGVDLKPGKHPGFSRLYVSDPKERATIKEQAYALPEVRRYNLDTLYKISDLKDDPVAGEFIRNYETSTASPADNLTFWNSPETNTFLNKTLPDIVHDYFVTLDPEDEDPNDPNLKRVDLHIQPSSPVITFKDKSGKRSSVIPNPFISGAAGGGAAPADTESRDSDTPARRSTRGSSSFSASSLVNGLRRLSSASSRAQQPNQSPAASEPEDMTFSNDNPLLRTQTSL